MRKYLYLSFTLSLFSICIHAQTANYSFVSAEIKSPSSVQVTLKTFADKRKSADMEAKCAALRIIMFDGIKGTIYNRPLLNQGTIALHENSEYFDNLFNNRLSDVIRMATMKSDFKKAEKGEKSTLYTIDVNYIQLKKDLEKNKIKTQLGL
ncbi:MAG: hypothetical protein J1E58_03310 [Prevotella sp.]|nr:hypothetical protein [Prevotella sp.]